MSAIEPKPSVVPKADSKRMMAAVLAKEERPDGLATDRDIEWMEDYLNEAEQFYGLEIVNEAEKIAHPQGESIGGNQPPSAAA